jgi:predicted secreted protein
MDRIAAESKLGAAERGQELKRGVRVNEHRTQMEGLRLEFEARRAESANRLEEQKLRQVSEILGSVHAVQVRTVQLTEEMRRRDVRFEAGQAEQVRQARTDLELAKSGIEALTLVRQAKREAREKDEALDLRMESERMQLRGSASLQALMATLGGEQADRVLKLAELELRKGLAPEQALALVVEQRPEIAPAIAEMLKVRLSVPSGGAG